MKAQHHQTQLEPHTRLNENVPMWCDCCTCEPEPHWQQVADELKAAAKPPASPARGEKREARA